MNKAKYTVKFPTTGNFKLVCLIHPNMNGTVHVLPASAELPHEQSFYTEEFVDQAKDLLHDADHALEEVRDFPRSQNAVLMLGEMVATAGGRQYLSIVRFLPREIHVHVGETVDWMNTDPTEPHTVTFGPPPQNIGAPQNVSTAADGAFEASISPTSPPVSSGILQAAPEDRTGLAQSPPGQDPHSHNLFGTGNLQLYLRPACGSRHEGNRGCGALRPGGAVYASALPARVFTFSGAHVWGLQYSRGLPWRTGDAAIVQAELHTHRHSRVAI